MAATSHPLATQAAIQILKNGGNAMDAAIAACAVQCVVEPHSTGVGGDCFCIYAPEGTDELVAYNGSGRAPAATDADALLRRGMKEIPRYSPVSVTAPGAVEAWVRLLQDHGRLSLGDVLAPAIGYAEDGFPISPRVHFDITNQAEFLHQDPVSSATYLDGGRAPAVGTVMRLPQLGKTLRSVAEEGSDVFYKGWIARDMVERLQALGGVHTMDDLAAVSGEYVAPIASQFRDRTIHECPPNGQGVIALLLLNMMQQFDIDPDGPLTADRIHLEIEACRLAYAARNHFVGDPEFSAVPVEALLSDDYARKLAGSIDMSRATVPAVNIDVPRHRDTVYISVVDEDRNACSFINTLFFGFGSGITAPASGVTLHNRGQGFTLSQGHPNRIAPGKRPLHTIIPGMESKDGRTQMSFGVMGGHYQAFGHMQFLTRHHDFGLDLQEAMDGPRFMANPFNGIVEMENAIDIDIQEDLVRRGHQIAVTPVPIGGSQAIAIDWHNNVLTGASDPRKDGCAIGY